VPGSVVLAGSGEFRHGHLPVAGESNKLPIKSVQIGKWSDEVSGKSDLLIDFV
jgi:hypothetical protein